jgi:hypothetical protein
MNWGFINYFYCVNLRPNTQRWIDSVREFMKVGIPWVERMIVDEPEDNRYLGFNRSMYHAVQVGHDTGHKFCLRTT